MNYKKKVTKLEKENKMLKKELNTIQNTKLVKELIHNLNEIRKGNFITREKLGF